MFAMGQIVQLKLAEANPVSGALRFEMPEGKGAPSSSSSGPPGKRRDRIVAKRGRPANIRHQGRKRR